MLLMVQKVTNRRHVFASTINITNHNIQSPASFTLAPYSNVAKKSLQKIFSDQKDLDFESKKLKNKIELNQIFSDSDFAKAIISVFSSPGTIPAIIAEIFDIAITSDNVAKIRVERYIHTRQKTILKITVVLDREVVGIKELPFVIYNPNYDGATNPEENDLQELSNLSKVMIRFGGKFEAVIGDSKIVIVAAEFVPGESVFKISQSRQKNSRELISLQRRSVGAFFDIYKQSRGTRFISDVSLGQIMLRFSDETIRIVDSGFLWKSSLPKTLSAVQIIDLFSGVFEILPQGMEESQWIWGSMFDKTDFFHGIIDALGQEEGMVFLESAKIGLQAELTKLRTDTNSHPVFIDMRSEVLDRMILAIEKYLGNGINSYITLKVVTDDINYESSAIHKQEKLFSDQEQIINYAI